ALRALLHEAQPDADAAVRAVLRPRVETALDEVGLQPRNLPERVARDKLVAELGDGALERGFLGVGHVRDALSRNQLKLDDLRARELVPGDALLGMNRRLGRSLAGVYRPAEVYLRFLHRLSTLFFGNPVGRFLTLYAILPFLGAYVLLEGLSHVVGPILRRGFHVHVHIFSWPACIGLAVLFFGLLH